MALALVIWRLLPSNLAVLRTRVLHPIIRCGEYPLVVYCASVLLSFAAIAVLGSGWNNFAMQTLVSIVGVAIMTAIAAVLARIDRTGRDQLHAI